MRKTTEVQSPNGTLVSPPNNYVPPPPLYVSPSAAASGGKRTIVINQFLGSFSSSIHPSHPLGHKRGVVWCWKCCVFAVREPQKLGDPCRPISTLGPAVKADIYGRACLSRIRRGLTPRSDMIWPDQGEHPLDAPPDLAIVFDPSKNVPRERTFTQPPKAPVVRTGGRADAT